MGDVRWFGVGQAADADARAAAEAASAAIGGREPALVIVYAEVGEGLAAVAEGVRSQLKPDTVLVGVSTYGQYATGGRSGGVVVSALGGPGLEIGVRVARGVGGRPREAGAEVGDAVSELTLPYRALVLLCDGLVGQRHELIRGVYSVTGAGVPLVGGCAGDSLQQERTYQVVGDGRGVEVLTDALIGVAIGCESALGIGLGHGWRKVGEPMLVTASEGDRIHELDGEPALDVYLRRIDAPDLVLKGQADFAERAERRPLGLSRRGGEDIRMVHAFDPEGRSLICLAEVPQGSLTWLMETDGDALVAAAAESAGQAVAMLDGAPPVGLLAFDCGMRMAMLGPEGVDREVEELTRAAGSVPYAGFYTNGEFARVRGARGTHQITLVTLALS